MKAKSLILKAKGLHTQPNEFGAVPPGAMAVADNVVISADDVVESRRGFYGNGGTFPSGAANQRATYMQAFKTVNVSHRLDGTLDRIPAGGGTPADYSGTYTPPGYSYSRCRATVAAQNYYFTTNAGVYKIESVSGTPAIAGAPKGLDLQASLSGTSGYMAGNTEVAYRVVWGYKDSNANLILGAPSGRLIYSHPIATATATNVVRNTNVVTVTTAAPHPFITGENVTLAPGETNFPPGIFTVASTPTTTSFTYAETAANATSTVDQTYVATNGRDVSLNVTIPREVNGSASYFYQVYRSRQSLTASTEPDDEMGLVWEGAVPAAATVTDGVNTGTATTWTTSSAHGFAVGQYVYISPGSAPSFNPGVYQVVTTPLSTTFTTAASGTAGSAHGVSWTATPYSVVFLDQIPDALRQAALYTSPGQEGILQANDRAPIARDLTYYKGCVFACDTTSKHRIKASIISVGGSQGLASGDTVTIAGQTYTAGTTENVMGKQFIVPTTGTAAQNVSDTTASLIRCINLNSANTTVYAYASSLAFGFPGGILLEERGVGGSSFQLSASAHPNAWQPALTSAQTSTNDRYQHRVAWSKQYQAESFPLLNYQDVGAADKAVMRIVAVRDALFILKEDGVWMCIGDGPANFQFQPLDPTLIIYGPETAAALGNSVWCLSNQGVVKITTNGVEIMSRPIEDVLLTVFGYGYGNYADNVWAVGYESARLYLLGLPTASNQPAQVIYAFNTVTATWTRWLIPARCGVVNLNSDLLMLGDGSANDILVERKGYTFTDYADNFLTFDLTSHSGKVLTLPSVTGIGVGDIVDNSPGGGNFLSIVSAVDAVNHQITVETTEAWVNGLNALHVFKAIPCAVQWVANPGNDPTASKRFNEAAILYRAAGFDSQTLQITTNLVASAQTETINGTNAGNWGTAGGSPWATSYAPGLRPALIPREAASGAWINIALSQTTAYAKFAIEGIALTYSDEAVTPGVR